MAMFLALLGSSDGPRIDLVVETARQLSAGAGGRIIETSPIYAERKNEGLKGVFVNAVILVEASRVPSKDVVRAIEAGLGRVRDAERNVPHTVDVDVLAWTESDGRLTLSDRKDLGGAYALFGAHAIEAPVVRAAVASIMKERDINDADVGRWFYTLASRELFASLANHE